MVQTRKDFIATAKILKASKASDVEIELFSRMFKAQNPRFDSSRFKSVIRG